MTEKDKKAVALIQELTAKKFGVTRADILGPRRPEPVTLARTASMQLCRLVLDLTFAEIGSLHGKRDHATARLAHIRAEDLADSGHPWFRKRFKAALIAASEAFRKGKFK